MILTFHSFCDKRGMQRDVCLHASHPPPTHHQSWERRSAAAVAVGMSHSRRMWLLDWMLHRGMSFGNATRAIDEALAATRATPKRAPSAALPPSPEKKGLCQAGGGLFASQGGPKWNKGCF
eukprot:NODE_964_length_1349_cov_72.413846_g800_i0.p2 GENE.NODE_964_length_1349_cov_72.413846_g800_i0~~NODE_964_length_1349_cov_72.413846_g800_i0.p2  ORF type:complete len:121 (-),score=15.63 NODE_964_length_1349_cov_72.413846_g800_i0:111-473(-)